MAEKNICIKSYDNTLTLNISLLCEEKYTDIEIQGNISIVLTNEEVLKAYITNDDLSKTNLGVISISFDRVQLTKRIPSSKKIPKEIYITKKNTSTEEEKIIAKGNFIDNSSYEIPAPLKKAEEILNKIKNASETNDQGISKRNCINIIKRNICSMKTLDYTFRMFDTFYISETFTPVADLSAVKFLMFEGLCTYSFFDTGYYYISLKENILLIAFREYNGQNPMYHIKDFTFTMEISHEIFYGVMIELADEGQYFIV